MSHVLRFTRYLTWICYARLLFLYCPPALTSPPPPPARLTAATASPRPCCPRLPASFESITTTDIARFASRFHVQSAVERRQIPPPLPASRPQVRTPRQSISPIYLPCGLLFLFAALLVPPRRRDHLSIRCALFRSALLPFRPHGHMMQVGICPVWIVPVAGQSPLACVSPVSSRLLCCRCYNFGLHAAHQSFVR